MTNSSHGIEKMVLAALMAALVAVMTVVVAIPVPFTNGYIHFGDSMIFMSVLVLGWKRAPLAAGLGSCMADVFLGYVYWAPWTLVIKGLMALIAGLVITKCEERKRNILASCGVLAAAWAAFSFAVKGIVAYEAARDQAALLGKMGAGASEFGEMLGTVQSQLMVFALVVPAAVAAIAMIAGRKGGASFSPGALLGMAGGGLFMVFGYYMAGGLIYGSFAYAAFSMPANIVQFVAGFFVAAALAAALLRTPAYKFLLRFR